MSPLVLHNKVYIFDCDNVVLIILIVYLVFVYSLAVRVRHTPPN